MTAGPSASDPFDRVRRDVSARPVPPKAVGETSMARATAIPAWLMPILLGLSLCLACALLLDVRVARMAGLASPAVRQVAQLFSNFGLSGYMLVLSATIAGASYVALRRDRFPGRAPLLALVGERAFFVFAAVGLSGIAVQILKHLVGRARPGLLDRFGAFHFDAFSLKASLASFPSGHSTSIFALAAAIGLMAPRLRLPLFAFAVAVALARVALGSHYTSDIVAGALLGVMTTLGVAHLFAERSIAFIRAEGELRLKGRGMILSALRAGACGARTGA